MGLKRLFNEIVDAIHEKDGQTDGIAAKDFPERIRMIPAMALDKNWKPGILPHNADWVAVDYYNGVYVATASGVTTFGAYSTNGIVWLPMNKHPRGVSEIIHFKGRFIGLGNQKLWLSDDGKTWEEDTQLITGYDYELGAASADSLVITSGNSKNYIAVSKDGTTWRTTTLSLGNVARKPICYGDGRFVMLAYSRATGYISYDEGDSWVSFVMPAAKNWEWIAYGNGIYLAAANASTYGAISQDGAHWEELSFPVSVSKLLFAGSRFMIIGNNQSFESHDGTNWTEVGNLWKDNWINAVHGDDKIVLISYSNYVFAYLLDPKKEEG